MFLNKYLVCVVFLFGILGCGKTQYLKELKTTDFLDGYFLVKEDREHDAALSYWKKGVDWPSYQKAILEPVVIKKLSNFDPEAMPSADELINTMTHADQYRIKEMTDYRMYEALKKGFMIVRDSGVDTLLIQFKITNIGKSPEKDSIAAARYSARIVSTLKELVKSTKAFAGKAVIETQLIDSMTGDILMVSEDVVIGETFLGMSNKLVDLEKATQNWAVRLSYQLCQRQSREGCQNPDEVNKEKD